MMKNRFPNLVQAELFHAEGATTIRFYDDREYVTFYAQHAVKTLARWQELRLQYGSTANMLHKWRRRWYVRSAVASKKHVRLTALGQLQTIAETSKLLAVKTDVHQFRLTRADEVSALLDAATQATRIRLTVWGSADLLATNISSVLAII